MNDDTRLIGKNAGLVQVLLYGGMALFFVALFSLLTHSLLYPTDLAVSHWAADWGKSAPVAGLMTGLIWLANIGSILPSIICVGLCAWYIYRKQDDRFVLIIAMYMMGLIIFWVLALAFNRVRPSLPGLLAAVPFPSFPSGHMIQTITLLSALLYLYLPAVKSLGTRRLLVALAVGYVLLVAVDRIVTNAHYITDVMAGTGIGLVWSITVLILFERNRAYWLHKGRV